jgi:hypothetical protein
MAPDLRDRPLPCPPLTPRDRSVSRARLSSAGRRPVLGSIAAEAKTIIDPLGGLWAKGKLVDKAGAVIVSTHTAHASPGTRRRSGRVLFPGDGAND